MKREPKITLGAARDSGVVALMLCCEARRDGGAPCHHGGELRLRDAIARWGEGLRLDQVPARCTACGARDVDVRPRWQRRVNGSTSAGAEYEAGDAY